MRSPAAKRVGTLSLAALMVVGLAGCYGPAYRPGPPPHAPAHVYHWQPYDYFYYPSVGVYFHIHSGYYYYRDGRVWRRSQWLPPNLIILSRDRVKLQIHDREPWHHHKEHRERYRPAPKPPRDQLRKYDREERDYNSRVYRDYRRDRR